MPVFENRGSYLFVTLTEPYSLQGMSLFLADLAERCYQEHLDKALIDGSRLKGRIRIWDRYQIAREYVRVLRHKISVAVVLSLTLINRVAENVAVNRSGRLGCSTTWSRPRNGSKVREEDRHHHFDSKWKGCNDEKYCPGDRGRSRPFGNFYQSVAGCRV